MYIDLHTHSIASDDSKASVEGFAQWTNMLRTRGFKIDGFVLTEHRQFDLSIDYSELSEKYNILILKGAELDTDCGHFLVYGINEKICDLIDLEDININAEYLIETCIEHSAIAIPAHPGRKGIGLFENLSKHPNILNKISAIEGLNHSNRLEEQIKTTNFIKKHKYPSIGGSDSHIVSTIGKCMTHFDDLITTEKDLVQALKSNRYTAVQIENTTSQKL